ncbi:hypothetical protein OAH88_01890 [Candidatus Pelagibacter sp.]|jgi:hypothetical protein|nr:hypothetical protein [Candidatus Pelagibacter sp.]|tara:strand:+ start:295 stop:579 length:285 start_codon:yes stop_codon:yes gene_type:complete
MNFYKKALFITLLIFIFFAALITVLEPVVDRQLSNIFADKKISTKLKNELLKGTENFTPEKRIFYKNVIKKIYIKWKPLLDEAIDEANSEISKN